LEKGIDFKLVHRLDKETSGILLSAKGYAAANAITTAFKDKLISKTYLACLDGIPKDSEGEVRNYLFKDLNRVRIVNTSESPIIFGGAKEALTRYRILKTKKNISLVEFKPKTGRMHQIRVHAASMGCPIIGDYKYGFHKKPKSGLTGSNLYQNMMLHAYRIDIPASVTGSRVSIEAPVPPYFPISIV
jgi:23S rRNA pseudouridine955/2504/2580 synthase